ncbi:MAG: hypothetical protein QG549_484 [Patescibacteria group bacterium]|nr:hypothetical protein [Patescibacteria group bacterium]
MSKKLAHLRLTIFVIFSAAVLVFSPLSPAIVHAIPGETIYAGTNTTLAGDDNYAGAFPLGFNFDFYGSTVSSTYININGTLNFNSGNAEFSNTSLPNTNMGMSVQAFWDDIITKNFADQSILYKTVGAPGSRKFIVQWTNMYFFNNPSLPMGTFQAILYEGTNKIQLQYRDLLGGDASRGDSATIGINKDGATADQVSLDTAFVNEGQAISFTPNGSGGYITNTNATYDLVYLADANAPSAPVLTTPANTATNVSTTPTFSWSAADQADTYQLIVASNADYSTIVINQSGLTGTSYTPGTALNTNTTYYWKVIAVNGSGTTISDGRQFTTVPPDDNDGADQSVEAAAPNDGDANDDGINDSLQARVTSFVNPVTENYTVLESSATTGNTNVSVNNETGDTGYTYPAGMLHFTVDTVTPGDTATITLYYYGISPNGLVLRKYNSTTHQYQNISDAVITSVTIGGQTATKVVYSITDGSSLDEDGIVDGHIVDPVGLAQVVVPGAPNTGFARTTISVINIVTYIGATGVLLLGVKKISRRLWKQY